MNWLAAYGFATDDTPANLGEPATLTVVLRDLDTDHRTYEFLMSQLQQARSTRGDRSGDGWAVP